VILDRWRTTKDAKPRDLEDLKHRYYTMVKQVNPTLMPYRFLADDNGGSTGQGSVRRVVGYDPMYERQRKDKLNTFYGRTGAQVSGPLTFADRALAGCP
jgi:hypothetical protein